LPRFQNWSVTFQRQLTSNMMLDMSYIGNHGSRLNHHFQTLGVDSNMNDPSVLTLGATVLQADINSAIAQAAGIKSPYAGFQGNVAQALRKYPQYQTIQWRGVPTGESQYHALEFVLERRFSRGLQARVAYTYSKLHNNGAETAQGDRLLLGKGSGSPPPAPDVDASGCTGRLGMETFAAPTFITHAVRVRVDRETGVCRVLEVAASHDCGVILNPVGAEGQVEGGVVMGIGMAMLEGSILGEDGRQRNPHLLDYKLQTSADAPPISIAFVDAPSPYGGPKGSKGTGEPPCVPTPGAIGNAIAQVTGARVHQLPMTPERVWAAAHGVEA